MPELGTKLQTSEVVEDECFRPKQLIADSDPTEQADAGHVPRLADDTSRRSAPIM